MFYVYILYMWPTVWIRSIIIILNSIYHYQFGMKTCYIYIFLRKKELQQNLLAYIQCFFSDTQNVISQGWCQHPFVGLLESMWKNIFRRKPTIREFKIECNRILLFIVLIFFFKVILYASFKFISKCSCWFLEDIILQVWVTTATRVSWCAQIQNFQKRKMVHPIKKQS